MRTQLHDLFFSELISAEAIDQRVKALGQQIGHDYQHQQPLFLCMLRGAFIFAADLLRACPLQAEISFVRLGSYQGTQSSGEVSTYLSPDPAEIKGRHIIIVEDIVDSGNTMAHFLPRLQTLEPASVAVATLLFKPSALQQEVKLDYVGFEIEDQFVVGYGLDYDGLGRGSANILQKVD